MTSSGYRISTRGSSPDAWLKQDFDEDSYSQMVDDDVGSLTKKSSSGSMSIVLSERQTTPLRPKYPSGSRGKLGEVLEKMHGGAVLSQHEVSAALRDYNLLTSKLEELKIKTQKMKLQVSDEESAGVAPPGESKITRDEKEKLNEQLKRKDKLIADYQKRFQRMSHKAKTSTLKNLHVEDVVPPEKIIENFVDLYEKEWYHAFEILKASWRDEEKAMFSLFRIVKHAYIFCFDIAEKQRTAVQDYSARLQEVMLQPTFIHPVSKLIYKPSAVVSTENQQYVEVGRRLLVDYKNVLVSQTVPAVQELFKKVKLPELFDSGLVNKAVAVRDFVDRTVELVWLMVVQEPPMMVYWLEPKQTVVKEYFKFYKERRALVRQTVWPAVFHKEGGALLSKGVVLAGSADDFED